MNILTIQKLLSALADLSKDAALDPGPIDGIDGPKTQAAITALKQADAETVLRTLDEALYDIVSGQEEEYHPPSEKPTTGSWWDDIEYFNRAEFACHCGGKYCNGYPVEPSEKLVRIADAIRKQTGKPITVSSGVRCQQHNIAVGGVANSRHTLGTAMDFACSGFDSAKLDAIVGAQSGVAYHYRINNEYVHMDVV